MKVILHPVKLIEKIINIRNQIIENTNFIENLYCDGAIQSKRSIDFSIVKDNILGDIVGGTSKCPFLLSKHEQTENEKIKYKFVNLYCSLLTSDEYQFRLILVKNHLVQYAFQDDYYTDTEEVFRYKDSLENSILSLIKDLNEYCKGDFIFELDNKTVIL